MRHNTIDPQRLERLRKAIEAQELTTTEIARAFNISAAHLKRLALKHGWRQAVRGFNREAV